MTTREITINVTEDTYNKIIKVAGYFQYKGYYENGKLEECSAEDVVKGGLNHVFEKMEVLGEKEAERAKANLKGLNPIKNNFKELLQKAGRTQKDIAEETKIDKSNLSLYFNNKAQPSMDYMIRIWIALGCPQIEKMFYRDPEHKSDD